MSAGLNSYFYQHIANIASLVEGSAGDAAAALATGRVMQPSLSGSLFASACEVDRAVFGLFAFFAVDAGLSACVALGGVRPPRRQASTFGSSFLRAVSFGASHARLTTWGRSGACRNMIARDAIFGNCLEP